MIFSNYSKYFEDGKYVGSGRGESRFSAINWDNVKGRSVLDLGCANGMLAIEAKKRGAARVVGVDIGDWIPDIQKSVTKAGLDIEFWQLDIESPEFKRFCPQFDIVFFCAVAGHLKNIEDMLRWIDQHTKYVLYFESNLGEHTINQIELVKKYTSFVSTQFINLADIAKEEGPRYLWFCIKKGHENNVSSWQDAPVTFLPIDKILGIDDDKCIECSKLLIYQELEKNIETNGLLNPLICCPSVDPAYPNYWQLREGGKRFCILKNKGHKYIPVKIVPAGIAPLADIKQKNV